jgi:hypothetical protein
MKISINIYFTIIFHECFIWLIIKYVLEYSTIVEILHVTIWLLIRELLINFMLIFQYFLFRDMIFVI